MTRRCLLLLAFLAAGCAGGGSAKGPPSSGAPDAGAGAGGQGGGVPAGGTAGTAPAPSDASGPSSPPPDAGLTPAGADAAGGAADARGNTRPAGPFPLAAVQAARPQLHAAASGHLEGPSWRNGEVFFAADGMGMMRADAQGKVYRYHPTLNPVGSLALADGTILICEKKYILVQLFLDGKVGVLVGEGTAATFCNDVTVDAEGNIYFSDAHARSIIRLTPAGQMSNVVTGRSYPNGVEIDPDSKYLYFSDTGVNMVFRTPLANPAAVERLGAIIADGMAFDAWGNIWLAQVTAGVAIVFDPVAKKEITRVPTGGPQATNFAFGGPDNDTLFATVADKGIMRVNVGARGFSHPGAPRYAVKMMLDLTPANTPVN